MNHTWSPALTDRVTPFNDVPMREGAEYVLVWLQQALRAWDNPTIDAGIELANALGLPVVVYHGLRMDYPHASDRLHRFILGASRDVERGCRERGLRCATYVETTDLREKGLVYRLASKAAAVITDEPLVFVGQWQARSFAASADLPVLAVDAARLVPTRILPPDLKGTSAFRKASGAHREHFLNLAGDFKPSCDPYAGDLGFAEAANGDATDDELDSKVRNCSIDHTLPASKHFPASRAEADKRLQTFVAGVHTYQNRRNNPADENGVSNLSPYIHFGVLGPREIARAVHDAPGKASPKWKFLDELLSWREWFHYLAHQNNEAGIAPESYETVPAHARETLADHADDEREVIYTLDQLLHGETEDETWNAAQKQWLSTGYQHNNLRMYWSKKIIEWTEAPEQAWITACYINDRISLDGRDPSTYGNMQHTFGRGKPGWKETPIFGWVPPKSDGALRKRPGVDEWLVDWANQDVPRIAVPNRAFVAQGFDNETAV